ncbi:MAG: hypothetical protein JWO06_363 [Bacteroidota bacterium]|nr:hypothetical protein [Bacteroidota bacterium]
MASLKIIDSLIVCIGGSAILISADHGLTWSSQALAGLPTTNGIFGPEIVAPRDVVSIGGSWIGYVLDNVAGYNGLYTSSDKGSTWSVFSSGNLPFVPNCIALFNNQLYVGSLGSGIWHSGQINTFSGNVYYDLNHNGTRDNGEVGLNNVILEGNPTGFYASTDTAGNYNLLTNTIGDTIKPIVPSPYGQLSPLSYILTGSATARNFGYYAPPNIPDLQVDITASTPIRSFFQSDLVLTVTNKGSINQSPVVTLVLDSNFSYISSTPVQSGISGDTLTWNLGNLNLLQRQGIIVTISNNSDVGSPITCYAMVTPVNHDSFPADNFAVLQDTVVSSFDPNAKECNLGTRISPQQVQEGTQMDYTIRFQNTGTASAINVKVSDTLSANIDPATLHILSSSHQVRWDLRGSGIVDFYFDNINLPTSGQDETGSHGFVKYAVKCKPSVSVGEAISNTGYIYFDLNSAIITNTTSTVVSNILEIAKTGSAGEDINAFPNPANDVIYIDLNKLTEKDVLINLFDPTGKFLKSQPAISALQSINVSPFSDGVYFGQVVHFDGKIAGIFRIMILR